MVVGKKNTGLFRAGVEGLGRVVKKNNPVLFRFLRKIFLRVLRLTRKDVDFFYNEKFARSQSRNKDFSKDMSKILISEFHPRSVIDFGCGTGDILVNFKDSGVFVRGVDGSKSCMKHSKLKPKDFILHDMRKFYRTKKKFDLCMCLEVAEHIEEKYSDILIKNIISASDTIIFTAAPPGQEGVDHCNLKPHTWWIRKFKKNCYHLDLDKTKKVKKLFSSIPGIAWWYVDNLLIFRKRK